MTDLTTAQKNQLRRRVGDSGATQAFSDPELQDAFDEAEEDLTAATVILLEWLVADAVKFNDYTAGQTSEKKSQVYDHLVKNLAHWQQKGQSAVQIRILGMRSVPPPSREKPGA
jgi:hypothetical protein